MNIRTILNRYYCLYFQNLSMVTEYKIITDITKQTPTYTSVDELVRRYTTPSHSLKSKTFLSNLPPAKDLTLFLRENEHHLKFLRGHMLDIGCGSGIYSQLFHALEGWGRKLKYDGCEIDQRLVDLAQKLYPQSHFFASFAERIKAKDSTYSLVLLSGVLQYTLDNWQKSLSEAQRVSSQYILIARLPLLKFSRSRYIEQKVYTKSGVGLQRFIALSRHDFESELHKLGLTIVSRDVSQEIYHVPDLAEPLFSYQYLIKK